MQFSYFVYFSEIKFMEVSETHSGLMQKIQGSVKI